MEQQINEIVEDSAQPEQFGMVQRKKMWPIILVTIIITAIIVGGGVCLWKSTFIKTTDIKITEQNKIIFLQDSYPKAGKSEIWTVNTDGTNKKGTGIMLNRNSRFLNMHQSPNLEYACFIDGNQATGEEVFLFNVKENKKIQISNSFFPATDVYEGSWVAECLWSVDSTKVAWMVSHHPHEVSDGGGLVSKDEPPTKFEEKMGVFIYDVNTDKAERTISLAKAEDDNVWLSMQTDPEWKSPFEKQN